MCIYTYIYVYIYVYAVLQLAVWVAPHCGLAGAGRRLVCFAAASYFSVYVVVMFACLSPLPICLVVGFGLVGELLCVVLSVCAVSLLLLVCFACT